MYKIMCNTKDTVHYALFLQEALQKGPGEFTKKSIFIREGGLGELLIIKKRNFWGGLVFKILYPLNNSYRTIGILINIL